MPRRYVQLDVFASRPGAGNPLAVVLDAQGLDDAAMQAIARWTRLPETTFVFPPTAPEATHAIRIFSPRREVPFAHGRARSGRSPSRGRSVLFLIPSRNLSSRCSFRRRGL